MFKTSGKKEEKYKNYVSNAENFLVISIDKNGKIVYFNKECEKIIGYYKSEVLNKNFDFLIPNHYYDQWMELLEFVKQDNKITDLKIPWQTRDGKEIITSWDIAPIENQGAGVDNIGLVGKLMNVEGNDTGYDSVNKDEVENIENKNYAVYNFGNKRIIFTNPKKTQNYNTNDKESLGLKEKSGEVDYKKIIKDYDGKKLKKAYENYDKTSRSADYLEKKVEDLEKENNRLKKLNKSKKYDSSTDFKKVFSKWSNFLVEVIGINKKRTEFNNMIQELDERKQVLNDLEIKINNEKKEINRCIDDFVNWREKLEFLEEEVEKRRLDVIRQEKIFEQKLTESLKHNICVQTDSNVEPAESGDNYRDVFGRISESAVLVQRGILKNINQSFADLVGFKYEELLDKSFFDFIAPEGLSGMEQYYMDRLKGVQVSCYDTVFIDKNDEKIFVQVEIKPVLVDGEKAEVFIVKEIKK